MTCQTLLLFPEQIGRHALSCRFAHESRTTRRLLAFVSGSAGPQAGGEGWAQWPLVGQKGDVRNICAWGTEMDGELGRGYVCVPVIHMLGAHAMLQLSKLILWVIQPSFSCHSPGV